MTFKRGLSQPFIDALNKLYQDSGSWWRMMLEDKDVFIAIRNERLNAYHKGASLAEVTFSGGEVRARTHYKYLLHPSSDAPYVETRNGQYDYTAAWPNGIAQAFVSGPSDLSALKKNAARYGGLEKSGVATIISAHPQVFDVEIALVDEPEDDFIEASAQRVDFAAMYCHAGGLQLRMYEAKHFTNRSSLRSKGGQVSAVNQIKGYEALLEEQSPELLDAYRAAAACVLKVEGIGDKRRAWAKAIVSADTMVIDTKPILVIFGYDDDQGKGRNWAPHLEKLRTKLGPERFIAAGDAKHVKLPGPKLPEPQ